MGGTDLLRRFKPRCVHGRCYATNAGNNHDQAQRISLSWATLPPIYMYIYMCVCALVNVRIVRYIYIYIYMIDCSLHGAMMSKHKVPTSFRPPSLRPQVFAACRLRSRIWGCWNLLNCYWNQSFAVFWPSDSSSWSSTRWNCRWDWETPQSGKTLKLKL